MENMVIELTTPLAKELFDGVSQATIEKLKAGGIHTLESLSATPISQVVELTGMGADTAEKVVRLAIAKTPGFQRVSERKISREFISTGSKALDALLGGGVETGAITELVGGYGSGKSQLVYTLSVIAQLPPEQGGINGKVAVIDTENTFREDRLKQVIAERGLPETLLDNIFVATALNTEHQEALIGKLGDLCNEGVRLVCVDSMIGNFRNEYIGRGALAERQQLLGKLLGSLLRIAQTYNVAVVTTNQLISNPDGNPYTPQDKPAGGHVMAHAGTQRVQLRRAKDNKRIASIIDSPNLPSGSAPFLITEKGVEDAEEGD